MKINLIIYLNELWRGRIGRKNYLLGFLFLTALYSISRGLLSVLINYLPSILRIVLIFFMLLFLLGYLLLTFSLHIRRLHDRGHNGWWTIIIGIEFWLNLIIKGQNVPNKYGEPPSKEIGFFDDIFNLHQVNKVSNKPEE